MGIKEDILSYQLNHGVFDNATFISTEGIAKSAVTRGFSTLSVKQKAILEPYLSKKCSGVIDPGGYHNECLTNLEGQALLDAYSRCDDTECLICESCDSDVGYYNYQWDRISRE